MSEIETCLDKALAAKGIGPSGLRPLPLEDLKGTLIEIANGMHPEALAATFVMAFQVLERDPDERELFQVTYESLKAKFSRELQFLFEIFKRDPQTEMEQSLKKLANRMDLEAAECANGVAFLLALSSSEVYKAAFLQGLRVKRESDSENLALFSKLFELAPRKTLDEFDSVLVDLSDPYDGMTRHAHLSFLVGIVLSAMGVPVVLHSTEGLGPKYGKTVLDYCDSKRVLNLETGALALSEVGVAILDQKEVFPELHAIKRMRNEMRKRPFLATVEKMLMPLRSPSKNILVTGYVHKAYKTAIPKMVVDHGIYDEIFLVKGVEGSVLLDPSKKIAAVKGNETVFEELEMSHEAKGVSPKKELNTCEISEILRGSDDRWASVEFTALKILEIALGGDCAEDIMREMTRLKNEELFLAQYHKVGNFYGCSGEYA